MSDENQYFAAKEAKETAGILLDKAKSFFSVMNSNAYTEKIQKMWRAYHGAYNDDLGFGHKINFSGEQGELVQLPVNHFRNLAQHIYVMITANRPAMEARAINTDYKSLAQTYLANGILDYYMREKHLEDALKKAVEMAVVLGSGFIKLEWNATAGDAYDHDEETGEFVYEGELEFSNLSPLDVIVDGTKECWSNDWIMIRTFQNRFNLMAKYPELADKIKGLPSKAQSSTYRLAVFSNDDTDDIPVYEFYHKKTEAMPDGRYILFADVDVVFIDAKMPYRVIPIFRIAPSDIMGTPYGYSPMFDVFPIQEGINSLYSTIMTNQNAFGVQNLYVPRGADINVNSLDGAMNIIEGNAKPEPLNLTETPAEVFKFLDMLIQSAETISGVNSVTRGNPEASLRSGNALALVQSMSLQFMSGLQQSYVKMIEDVGTALIQILKDYANTPKVVALVGKNNRPLLKEFTGESISAINRVVVDVGNPLAKCLKKDTEILMFDGTIKMVQDIKVGDKVMGPDSNFRTVTNINSGEETMYDIHSIDKHQEVYYGCNESHILTLRYCSDDSRYNAKQGQEIDISVKDYLKLPKRHKRLLMGFKTGVSFSKKDLSIPPYILGLWLGDGNSRTTQLTSMDNELVQEWTNYANFLGLKIRVEENKQPNKSKNYFITSGKSHGNNDRNEFMNSLRKLNLIKNKHIPFNYLTSSEEDRLNLLAGFLDTDGTLVSETFIITQKSDQLAKDLVYLARSLGFRVTSKKIKSQFSSSKNNKKVIIGEYNKISIGGNTSSIPTKLKRKQAKKKEKSRNWLNYGIKITNVGMGTFYGFTLKEEPHFILGDFTVTHNTIAGRVQMAEQMLRMKILKTPEQYFQVLNTGRLDSAFEGETAQLLLVKSENEKLMEGSPILATILDKHRLHIQEHSCIIADPDLREDPVLVKNVLDHIQEHINYLRTADPDLLQLINEQPLNPPGQIPPNGQLPTGPMVPQEGSMPEAQGGLPQGGDQINGPGNPGIQMPNVPKPPAPFQNLPVNPQDQIPNQ